MREFDPALELKYNKFYIGLARKGRADNFVTFTPRKKLAGIEPRIPRTDELDTQIKSSGLDLSYDNQWGRYRLSFDADGLKHHRDLIKKLVGLAFQNATSA